MSDWNTQKAAAEAAAAAKWGMWRKFIAANPLTGFWSGTGLGAAIVATAWKLLG